MKFLKRKKTKQSYLTLDIGSVYIKAVIFSVEDGKINILGYGKHQQKEIAIKEGIIQDLSLVVENCELAITQASLQAGVRPAETVIGLAGEQIKGFTTIVQFERNNPKSKISEKEIMNIVEKVQETAYKSSLQKFRDEIGRDDLEIKLINAALTHIMLDGNVAEDPIGFPGQKMQMGVFNAYTPLVQIGNLQKLAAKLGVDLIGIATEPYTLADIVIPKDDLDFGAIILDIGGDTTNLIIIQNQEVVGTRMFALGGRSISNSIAKEFNIAFEEAEQLKEKYVQKTLEDKNQIEKIHQIILDNLFYWETGLEVSLSEFDDLDYFPAKVILVGGESLLPEIKESVDKVLKSSSFTFHEDVSIEILTPQQLDQFVDKTGRLESPQEIVPLSLAKMMEDLIEEKSDFDTAIREGVKL